MSKLEEYRPRLCLSELFFHNDKIVLKSGLKQAILPVQALHFLTYFNGQYDLKEIIKRNHAAQKTVHFEMFLRTLIRLKEKDLLENGREIDDSLNTYESLSWLLEFPKPLWSFNLRSLTWSFSSPFLFTVFAIGFILLSLFSVYHFPLYQVVTEFLRVQGNYWKGGVSLLFCLSVFLSLKYLIQICLQLLFLGKAYDFKTIFNGICFYFHVGSDMLFLSPRRVLVGMYFLCGASCFFVFPYMIQVLSLDMWILGQAHLAALILFLSHLNPLGQSDVSQLFRLLYNDDNLNKVSHLFKDHSMLVAYKNSDQQPFRCFYGLHLFSSIVWTLMAMSWIHYGVYENVLPLMSSLESKVEFDRVTVIVFFILSFIVSLTLTINLVQVVYVHLFMPFTEWFMRMRKKILDQSIPDYDKKKLLDELGCLPLFNTFTHSMLQKVVDQGRVVRYKKDHRIIIQGDVGTDLFVLLSGSLKVRNTASQVRTLGEIKPVSIFGEIAFIEKKRRTAEVISAEESLIFKIDAPFMRNLISKSTDMKGVKGAEDFKNAIIINQFFHSSPFFKNLSEQTMQLLTAKGQLTEYHLQEVIFQQGQLGEKFYLVIRGSVGVYVDGQIVNKIRQGSFFGEVSLIANIPRIASVRVLDRTLLLTIDRNNFWDIISQNLELAVLIEFIGKMRIKESIEFITRKPSPRSSPVSEEVSHSLKEKVI